MGSYEKPTFSDEEKKKFSDFNRLDEDLYQMSNQTFWEKATERPGGISQLNKDVQNLKVKSVAHQTSSDGNAPKMSPEHGIFFEKNRK